MRRLRERLKGIRNFLLMRDLIFLYRGKKKVSRKQEKEPESTVSSLVRFGVLVLMEFIRRYIVQFRGSHQSLCHLKVGWARGRSRLSRDIWRGDTHDFMIRLHSSAHLLAFFIPPPE